MPLGTAWYSRVCSYAPTTNADPVRLWTSSSAEMRRIEPALVTVEVKATTSPGAMVPAFVCKVAVTKGSGRLKLTVSVTAIDAHTLPPGAQPPAWQVSGLVQLSPSVHELPFGLMGFEQTPVDGLHVPARWHWSDAKQVTGLAPVHVPAWQVSVWVHASGSVQDVPLALGGFEQVPV